MVKDREINNWNIFSINTSIYWNKFADIINHNFLRT